MSDVELVLKIPEELANDARAIGLLTNEHIVSLLQSEVEREKLRDEALRQMRDTAAQLKTLEPHLTPDEIEAEIRAYRTEQQSPEE
jgi:hypothetical protein